MQRKFFPLDKNYVLEEAQLSLKESLLYYLVDFVKVQYMLQYNSLGLVDTTIERIKAHETKDLSKLYGLYEDLMGVFRYKYYHDNQLMFDFDGRDPYQKYCDQWTESYKHWIGHFCQHKNFIWGVLELTVFFPHEDEAKFIGGRLQAFVSNFFELKIHSEKGISKKSA